MYWNKISQVKKFPDKIPLVKIPVTQPKLTALPGVIGVTCLDSSNRNRLAKPRGGKNHQVHGNLLFSALIACERAQYYACVLHKLFN